MDNKPRKIQRASILVLAFVLIGWWLYGHIIEPSPFFAQPDPEMAYFIDSLNIFKGNLYGFYHHPGTPVEIIGTIILAATYPFIRGPIEPFIFFHIQNPHIFLGIVRALLILGSIASMVVFTKYAFFIRHWTDELVAAAIAVLYFVIHPWAFTQIISWSHNSFSFPIGTLISLWLFSLLRSNQRLSKKQLVLIGITSGILTAVQMYYVTWVIGAIISVVIYMLIQECKWRQILNAALRIGVASLIGFVVVTLPIYQLYPTFLGWVIGILSHQGHYGDGLPGFASLELLITSFTQIWRETPGLIFCIAIILVMVCITYFFRRKTIRHNAGTWAVGFGLTIQIIITFTLILKHPNVLYLQAVAALLPVLIAVLFNIWQFGNQADSSSRRLLKFSLAIIIFSGFFFNLYRAGFIRYIANQQVHAATQEMDLFLENYAQENGINQQTITVLYTYGIPSRCFALRYGSSYANNGLSAEIDTICPNKYKLGLWENSVHLSDGSLLPPEDVNWDIIITLESMILEFPDLQTYGDLAFSDTWLPSFGKIAYIVSTGD